MVKSLLDLSMRPRRFCPHAFVNWGSWASGDAAIVQISHAIELELKIHKLPPKNLKGRQNAIQASKITLLPTAFLWQHKLGCLLKNVSIVQMQVTHLIPNFISQKVKSSHFGY